MKLNLFPAPRKVVLKKKTVDISDTEWIIIPSQCGRRVFDRVLENTEKIGKVLKKEIKVAKAVSGENKFLLEILLNDKLPSQGYKLSITPEKCELIASDDAGAYYGFLAFTQLVEQFGNKLPAMVIDDSPDFPARGVMLDVSRCKVMTMETLKQLIERLASVRINQVQLYIEHTFAFAEHKTVWEDSSPFTHQEILEIDKYCADRFVDLVPNLNSFGHFSRWLRHPDYRHLAECPENKGTDCLAPNNESIKFLEGLYDEYLPHFSNSLINVGCDETRELGTGRSKKKAEKTSTTRVYLEFLKKIHKLVVKKGSRMQFWGDIILHQPELIKELPKDIVALCWGYDEGHPYSKECKSFAESGIEFYVCPGTSAWNSITGRTDNCLANLASAARNGSRYGATGFLNTDWGDGGHHQVLPMSYLGFAAGAAYSWCFNKNKDADLAGALDRYFFEDPTGMLGQFCLDLGRTLNKLPGLKQKNCSAISQLLRMREAGKPDISKLTKAQFNSADKWLDKVEKELKKAKPAGSDSKLVINELSHALEMARHVIKRGRFAKSGDGNASALKKELHKLIESHKKQWLARNRKGGLKESCGDLKKSEQLF